jgi:hypothetical protein
MGALLGHLDIMPFIYGVIMYLGILSMYNKFVNFRFKALFIEIAVFILVFTLHGGSMTGGMSAMIAALLCGTFLGRTKS